MRKQAVNGDLERLRARREFVKRAASGTALVALGGISYVISDDLTRVARAETLPDGRSRVPPGQRVIHALKPMGGEPGDPDPARLKLRVHGAVEKPLELGFAEFLKLPQVERALDVHCVTGWTVLGARFEGVLLKTLLDLARPTPKARYLIWEGAHGYTSNMPLREALAPNVMVAQRLAGAALPRAHGGPLRAVVPQLYFWKSAKWLEGIRLSERDEPGYWEVRGYNNHADPWREERYA
ncbi:MAG TPA: molybdopterin-dependent oxidoreductase [Polyangiaceae bacterium]|nr:molybdopterin-dependent oxidoreductase [Polyangiaceae bacterium]